MGIERVEIGVPPAHEVYRDLVPIDRCIRDSAGRTHGGRIAIIRRIGCLPNVGGPDLVAVQIRRVLAAIPRTPEDEPEPVDDHRLSRDGVWAAGQGAGTTSRLVTPFELEIGCRGLVDDGLGSIEAAAPIIGHVRGPIARFGIGGWTGNTCCRNQ